MSIPKKILMTADCIGGVWTYVLDLCSCLSSKGIRIALAVMGSKLSGDQKAGAKKIHGLSLFESEYKLEWMDNPWDDISKAGEWLLDIKNIFEPEIVHLNSYSFGSLGWDIPVLITAHSDVFSWWNDVKNEEPPPYWNEYLNRTSSGLHYADIIVAPSNYMLSALERNFGSFKNKRVIYNGRDRKLFRKDEKKRYIFASGRIWDEAKNLVRLVKAAPRLNCPVFISGENNHPVNGKHLDVAGINFTGKLSQDRLAAYLSGAALFIHPAKYEPFGLSPLEAAYSGAALLLADIPSLKEIWNDSALYFNPDDEDQLTRSANRLLLNNELLEQYSELAFNHSFKYSADKMSMEYIAVYSALIRAKNKQPKIYS